MGVLLLLVLVTFHESILERRVVFEHDTLNFYYPLESWVSQELKQGHFPLWNPNIFAGYPIFADGELGLANPLHLLLLILLPVEQAYVWQRVAPALIGAASMFFFCRTLGLRGLATLLGGLVFGLGSFLAEQRHHDDIVRTVTWAPLVLACAEMAFQRSGWLAIRWLIGAALALTMTALGLHPQGLAMTALLLATYMLFRALFPIGTPSPLAGEGWGEGASAFRISPFAFRLSFALLAGLFVATLGLGLAAVQLWPTAQAGLATYRESQPAYAFATSYELHPQNLISLVFPYFFRAIDSRPWTLWAPWEVTVYVGIVPLVLGLVGLVRGPRPLAFYFGGIAVVGLWLALAATVPLDLYAWLWRLPGFSALRVPGRYVFFFVVGWSVLAAYGLAALSNSHPASSLAGTTGEEATDLLSARRRWRPPSPLAGEGGGEGAHFAFRIPRSALAAVLVAMLGLAAVAGLALGLNALHVSLLGQEAATEAWIEATYLSLPHGEGLTADIVYLGLVHSLDPTTPRTAASLVLLAITVLLLAGITLGSHSGATSGAASGPNFRGRDMPWPSNRGLWSLALVAAAGADLISFGTGLHYSVSLDQLAVPSPAAQFLQAHAGPWRVFSAAAPLTPSVQPDRLAPLGIEDFAGYSSLESRRNFSYWAQLTGSQNQLLDLANIRYVVYPARLPALPDIERVPFNPTEPLMVGGAGTAGGVESYSFGGKRADQVWAVAALTQAFEIPQGAVVVELSLYPSDGPPVIVPLRAGIDVAEWAYDRSDARGKIQHQKPESIAYDRPDLEFPTGQQYFLHLYFSQHALPQPVNVERVEIRYVYPAGALELYGLGLYDAGAGLMAGTAQTDRSKFRSVYQDREVQILENTAAFPRAYMVPGAVLASPHQSGVGGVLYTPFDPSREVLLEADGEPWVRPAPEGIGLIEARPLSDNSGPLSRCGGGLEPVLSLSMGWGVTCTAYQVSGPAGGFLVYTVTFADGWRASVDGQETPVLRANYLFQAVPVPPGDHIIALRYEPPAVGLGLMITGAAALLALLMLAVCFLRGR